MNTMNIHDRIRRIVATLLGALPTGLLAIVAAFAASSPASVAQAAGGQCKWEGGPGAPTHAVCSVEDCTGRGGLAQCSGGVGAVQSPRTDAEVGPDKWVYSGSEDYYNPIFTNPYWCAAAGGWFGS